MGFNKPQGWQGAAKAATGIAPLKKYISQKAGSFEDQNRGVRQKDKKKEIPKETSFPNTKSKILLSLSIRINQKPRRLLT